MLTIHIKSYAINSHDCILLMSSNRYRALARINFIHTGTRKKKKEQKNETIKGQRDYCRFCGGDVEVNVKMKEILGKPLY